MASQLFTRALAWVSGRRLNWESSQHTVQKGTRSVCRNPSKWCHYSSQQPWKVLSKLIEAWSYLSIVVGSGERERRNKFTLGKHCRARLVRSDKLAIAKQVLQPTSSEKQPLGCVCESESHSEVKGNLSLLFPHLGQSLASPSQPWRLTSPQGLHLGQVQSLPSCLHVNYGLFSHALSPSPFSVPLCPAVIHCVPHR